MEKGGGIDGCASFAHHVIACLFYPLIHLPPSRSTVSFLSRPLLLLLCVKTCPGQQWARTDRTLPEPVHRLLPDIRFDNGFVALGEIHVHTACAVPDGQWSDLPCAHHSIISKMNATLPLPPPRG